MTLSIYLIFFGITHAVWGPLIDHYGRRRILPGTLLLAFVGSVVCAFSMNIYMLLAGRALQGLALCCASLVAYSSARDYEDPIQRAKIISYINMVVSASPIFAPVLGALVFKYSEWQFNFVLMACIALVLYVQSRKSMHESPHWTAPKTPFSFGKLAKDLQSMTSSPALWCSALVMMFSFTAVMLTIIHSSYLIIDVLGYSPLGYGVIFIFNGLNIILGNYVGIWLRERFQMKTTIYLGHGLIMLGGICMFITMKLSGFSLLALSFALISNLGISVSAPSVMSIALGDFPDNPAMATAFINTIRVSVSALLTMVLGHWITIHLEALPIGLMLMGVGAALFSTQIYNTMSKSDDEDVDGEGVLS